MTVLAAWMLIALGIGHVCFGMARFRAPIREAVAEGFVGRFMRNDARRLAFWFILVGPLLVLLGQIALRASEAGDLGMIRLIGLYLGGAAALGVLAFPRSPLWALWPPAAALLAAGFGWIT